MLTVSQKDFDLVIHWIKERESIRKLKEAGAPKPWTTDPILLNYRFCNVRRMSDAVSVDLMTHWYSHNGHKGQLVAAALGRLINWPEALLDATAGRPFALSDLPRMRPALCARQQCGLKVFTGAYVVPGVPGMNKVDSIMNLVDKISSGAEDLLRPTLRLTWEALKQLDGLGSFLAGQIAADLAQLTTGEQWPDRFTFAPVGPGSARGLNRVFGRPYKQAVSQEQFDIEFPQYVALVRDALPNIFEELNLCAQDMQSSLCEGDKYLRITRGEGQVRARYPGIPTTHECVDPRQHTLF